jgi:predicted amidohydrolase
VRVALYQFSPSLRDAEGNLQRLAVVARRVAAEGVHLLVVPERCLGDSIAANVAIAALESIANESGLSVLAGVPAGERRVSTAALVRSARRGHATHARASEPSRYRPIVRLQGELVAVVVGDALWSPSRVRSVLSGSASSACERRRLRAPPAVLCALASERDLVPIARACELATSDAVTVVVCNASHPDGSGGSGVVSPDGEVRVLLGKQEDVAVFDLPSPRGVSPLVGLPDTPTWLGLDEGERERIKLAVLHLIRLSQSIADDVRRQGTGFHAKRVARRQIASLWNDTAFGELWRRLALSCREQLISEVRTDLARIVALQEQYDHGLADFLTAPARWVEKRPVTDVTDAGNAILRRAVKGKLLAALQIDPNRSRADFKGELEAKLVLQRADASSIFFLTQPYLQAMAKNLLSDALRYAQPPGNDPAGVASIASRVERLDVLDFLDDLSPVERQIIELRHSNPGLSDLEVAASVGRPAEEVAAASTSLRARGKTLLGES